MKKLFKNASGWVLIIAIILLPGCEQAYPPPHTCEPVTFFVPVKIEYGIINNDRAFGNAPDVWAASVKVVDSAGVQLNFLLTEIEYKVLVDRHWKNLTDTIKK